MQASKENNVFALYNLAVLYRDGLGVKKDEIRISSFVFLILVIIVV